MQQLKSFFTYQEMNQQALEKRLSYLGQREQVEDEVCLWLKETNLDYGCGQATLEAIDHISLGAPVVVTGQQAGFLTGPLYTIHKAASAIKLAKDLSQQLGAPVVPVFWLASEDHDFQEVRSAYFPGGDTLEELNFPGEYNLTPAVEIPLTRADVEVTIDRLQEILPETEFTQDILDLVKDGAGGNFAHWCAGILSGLFQNHGLVILDSCGLPVRRAARPIFARALERGDEIHDILGEAATKMTAGGLTPGLDVPRQHSHLFYLRGRQRLGLIKEDGIFKDRNQTVGLTQQELKDIVQRQPWRLSPNVVLRPLVQERLLPVLAMVAGPGELKYLAQLTKVFTLFGLEQPPLYNRFGGTLVEPPIARLLDKYSLGVKDVESGLDQWLEMRLAQADPLGIPQAFDSVRGEIQKIYADLVPGLGEVDKQLEDLALKNQEKVLEQVQWLQKRAEGYHRKKHDQLRKHANRLKTALAPNGPQQRVHNVLWYLNKYGPELIELLVQQPLKQDLEIQL